MENRFLRVKDLLRLYADVELTLRGIERSYRKLSDIKAAPSINIQKLVSQLSHSKKRIERRLGNTLMLEKHAFQRKLTGIKKTLSASRVK